MTRSLRGTSTPIVLQKLSLYHVAAVAIFAMIFLTAVLPRFDTDFWWHIFVGRNILEHFRVPTTDFLSYTFRGHPWLDHEWLSEVWMYAVYKFGGAELLLSVFAVITTGAYIVVYILMRSRGVSTLLALTLTLMAGASSFGSWGPRVQMITLLFAAFFCLALERYHVTGRRQWLIALVALMLIWSNLHGGFVIGLLLISVYMIGRTLDGLRSGWSVSSAVRSQSPLLITLIGAFAVTLFNPNTYHQLLYPLKFVLPNAFTNVIQESQSPNFHLVQLFPFELMLLGLIVSAFLARRRVSWVDILLVALFTHLALQQTRNIALWGVIAIPVLGVYLQDSMQPVLTQLKDLNRPVPSGPIAFVNLMIVLVVLVFSAVLTGRYVNASTIRSAQTSSYPIGAVRFVAHHDMRGNVFNSYNYGGYMIWSLDDRYPVFIDSRADTLYSSGILHDYLTVYQGGPGWKQLLQTYRIRWVLVEKNAPIAQILTSRDDWRVDFVGKLAMVIARRYSNG